MKKILAVFIVVFAAFVIFVMYYTGRPADLRHVKIMSFEECVRAGNVVTESDPRECRTGEGELFIEKLNIEEEPNPPEVISSGRVKFGTPFTMQLGDPGVVLDDESFIRLTAIEDSRCPEDVVCVWEGELAAHLVMVIRGTVEPVEMRLGAVRSSVMQEDIYTFTLEDITENEVTLSVTQ